MTELMTLRFNSWSLAFMVECETVQMENTSYLIILCQPFDTAAYSWWSSSEFAAHFERSAFRTSLGCHRRPFGLSKSRSCQISCRIHQLLFCPTVLPSLSSQVKECKIFYERALKTYSKVWRIRGFTLSISVLLFKSVISSQPLFSIAKPIYDEARRGGGF